MENMNNQGKRPDQYENSMILFSRSMLGIIILIILMNLLGGCATTNEAPQKPCCKTEKKC